MATIQELVIETLVLTDEVFFTITDEIVETLVLTDSVEDQHITVVIETLILTDSVEDNVELETQVTETLILSDTVQEFIPTTEIVETLILTDIVVDTITDNEEYIITETLILNDIVQDSVTDVVVETLELQDVVIESPVENVTEVLELTDTVQETITDTVTEQLILTDSISSAVVDTIIEKLILTDIVVTKNFVTDEIVETLILQDEVEDHRTVFEVITESLILNDEIEFILNSPIVETIVETLILTDSVYSKNPQAIAWVVNSETGAPSYFENFGFDSIVEHNGELIAASIEGLFVIEPTNSNKDYDDVEINSLVQSGLIDWGTDQRKRIRDLYLGYTGDHHKLTVETSDAEGQRYEYELETREAETIRNNRVRVGRGLNSRFWRFTLENCASGDSKITDMIANVDVSKRRL